MGYAIQKNVDEAIDKLAKIEDNQMLIELEIIKKKIEQLKQTQMNCTSDMVYWGYTASIEEHEMVREYIENRIFEHLKINSPQFVKIEKEKETLGKIKQKAKTTIENLNEYKPTNYKKMIDIIEKVVYR